jgi:hypothetical protein
MAFKLRHKEKLETPSNDTPRRGQDNEEDDIAPEAVGGTNADLPPGYYRSPSFIGTVAVRCIALELNAPLC